MKLLSALVALGLLGVPAARATEVPFSYCPLTSLSGTASYSGGGVSRVQGNHGYTLSVRFDCAWGSVVNRYWLTLSGYATGVPPFTGENCAQGHSTNSTVSGTSSLGPVSGWFSFDRSAAHYVVNGSVRIGGNDYTLLLWLDVFELLACPAGPVTGGSVNGHGALVARAAGQACTLLYGPSQTEGQYEGLIVAAWLAPNALAVSVTCTVRVGSPDGPVTASVSRGWPREVVALAEPVSFAAPSGQDIWICSDIHWVSPDFSTRSYERCDRGIEVPIPIVA